MVASVLFAAPTQRERGSAFKTNPWVAPDKFPDNLHRAVAGVVVEDNDFKVGAAVGQNRLQGGPNVFLFVARGNPELLT
jgi:hypothetical protein